MGGEEKEKEKAKKGKIATLVRLWGLLRGGLGGSGWMKVLAYVVGVVVQARLVIGHVLCTSGMMSCVFSAAGMGERKSEFFRLCIKVFWGVVGGQN